MSTSHEEKNSRRICEICKTEKSDEDFYRIADKQRGTIRVEKCCKACKVQISLQRKAKKRAYENPNSFVTPNVDEGQLIQQSPPSSDSKQEDPKDSQRHLPKKYTHPAYEDWEVAQAIEVFQILQKKRDEARRKGLINW